jgi:exodeoxyribonuclease VII large subunit
LRDVASTLTRRVPHIPITIFPASVQGVQAPDELCAALRQAFDVHARTGHPQVLLLVRGGGALEDLWAFNSEMLARTLAQAPMPVVCGVGHETDFTIADFVADLRAPTPTAAAELCATDRETAMNLADRCGQRLSDAVLKKLDMQAQHLDRLAQYLARPSDRIAVQQRRLQQLEHALSHQSTLRMKREIQTVQMLAADYSSRFERHLQTRSVKLAHLESLLHSFDPRLVLQRGYAWLSNEAGQAVTGVHQTHSGQILRASLADGEVDLTVR